MMMMIIIIIIIIIINMTGQKGRKMILAIHPLLIFTSFHKSILISCPPLVPYFLPTPRPLFVIHFAHSIQATAENA